MTAPQRSDDGIFRVLVLAAERMRARGARYGDLRAIRRAQEGLEVRNEVVDRAFATDDFGFGVRVLVGDAWGFAAADGLDEASVFAAVDQALAIAHACAPAATRPVGFGARPPERGRYTTPHDVDPIDAVSPGEKVALLTELTAAMRRVTHVVSAVASTVAVRTDTWFVSTEGSRLRQRTLVTGGGITATAHRDGETQQRTYPKHFEGNVQSGGWERFLALDLKGNARRVAEEAVALCTAPVMPAGRATVILDPSILSLQVHESTGHPTELDRAFGEEISLAGGSFLTPDRAGGDYVYGSSAVNLYADATTPLGAGTFGWDDEGTPAHRTELVREGRFVGYLSGHDAASRLGVQSAGSLRTTAFHHVPIVRMINVNLAPGQVPLDELLADTEGGFYVSQPKSWSIDDRRLNFQFGCEAAWRIEGGRLGTLYRNPVYTGITPRFWAGCDAIANEDAWSVWGYLDCGKGDPIQTIHVGHGVSPARFRDVEVGST